MDIGKWMEVGFRVLSCFAAPANILQYGMLVRITRMDRLMKGVAPSPFVIESLTINRLDTMQKFMQKELMMVSDVFTGASHKILDAGGIGQGIVVFLVSGGSCGPTLFRFQYHNFHERPPGKESPPSRTGWENVVKGVVNGEIPISLVSRRIWGPLNDLSSESGFVGSMAVHDERV
ncbi:hypothetical protein B0H12DRAFT_1232636 [Mycena haematopus]|nr:hypothetical protein B0H12DRAFT_1232636 [Mycena haematopus]